MTTSGVLFFAAHLIWMLYSLRFARSRGGRIEYIGRIVPGMAGLLIAVAPWTPYRVLSIILPILSVLLLIAGRGAYEMIVFRRRDSE